MSRGDSVTPGIRPRFAIGSSTSLMSPVKSMGVAPQMYEPTANESTGAPSALKYADPLGVEPARDDDLDVLEPFLVEARPDLLDEVAGDAAALRRRVEPDPVQPVAQRVGDPERLLGLVLERVDEDDPGHVGRHVAVERLAARTVSPKIRTIEWGIVPVGREAREPRARGCRRADAAADDRGVVEDVRDVGMDVARAERDHRLRGRGVDALARGRGPAGRLREHPEDRRLVQPERAVSRA